MAPKKAAGKEAASKEAKKGDAKGKKDEGEKDEKKEEEIPKERFRLLKKCSNNICCQLFACLLILALCLPAAIYTYLYWRELSDIADEAPAVQRIHKFMRQYNETYANVTELEAMAAVKDILDEIVELREKNVITQYTIDWIRLKDTAVQKFRKGWVPFQGNLYLFADKSDIYSKAVAACKKEDAAIVQPSSPEEEDFVEQQIIKKTDKNIKKSYWIGLKRQGSVWFFEDGTKAITYYWGRGFPKSQANTVYCAYMLRCSRSRRCWADEMCGTKRGWICKWVGEEIQL